jgi:predicted helicase
VPEKGRLNLIGRKLTKLELNELLKDAIEEKNRVKKGKKFELFFENFMEQQDGFLYIDKHCRSKVGEIDYFYRSEHTDHPIWKNYHYVFIECKNWEDVISSTELDHFIRLMKAKTPFACCGVYLTTSSLSPEALTTMRDARMNESIFIIPIESNALSQLIEKGFKSFAQEVCDKLLAKA